MAYPGQGYGYGHALPAFQQQQQPFQQQQYKGQGLAAQGYHGAAHAQALQLGPAELWSELAGHAPLLRDVLDTSALTAGAGGAGGQASGQPSQEAEHAQQLLLPGLAFHHLTGVPQVFFSGGGFTTPLRPGALLDEHAAHAQPVVTWGSDAAPGSGPGAKAALGQAAGPSTTTSGGLEAGASAGPMCLICFDPDAPSPAQPSQRSWLHWLVKDAQPGQHNDWSLLKDARTVVPWAPPTPPRGTHRYIFLVCSQPPGAAIRTPSQRNKFDVGAFCAQYGLQPVGLTFFRCAAPGGA